MGTVTGSASAVGGGVLARPRIGLKEARLVVAGTFDPADPSTLEGAALAFSERRPTILVLDLRQLTFICAPPLIHDERRLVLVGELDLVTGPAFARALTFALRDRPARVVLDLRRLTLIDARSAGAIAIASERMAGWGGALVARRPPGAVRRVFELCGLGSLLAPPDVAVDLSAPSAAARPGTPDAGRSSVAVPLR